MTPVSSRALLLVVSAPSGAGKTTLCNELLGRDPRLSRAVTCTTRPPRPGEREGLDYYFLSAEAFHGQAEQGAFLEHATVHGHSYGTLRSEVLEKLRAGRDVLLNIDVQGAESIRACAARDEALKLALCTVFLAPPSLAELEARLRKRAQDAPEEIQRRLAVARNELAQWRAFDYVVVSDTVPQSTQRLQSIVEAERLRSWRVAPPAVG
jgi:guanylate kinase